MTREAGSRPAKLIYTFVRSYSHHNPSIDVFLRGRANAEAHEATVAGCGVASPAGPMPQMDRMRHAPPIYPRRPASTQGGPEIVRPSADRRVMDATWALPLTALVNPDGSVEELDTPDAACYLGTNRKLIDYARAFTEYETRSARFFWRDPGGRWVHVCMDDAPPGLRGSGVLVTLTPASLPERLTPRELDVLTLMAGGLSNQQIAARLISSSRTISTHVEHTRGKLGQTTRTGAAGVAVDRGYLRLPLPGRGNPPEGLTVGFLHARAEGA